MDLMRDLGNIKVVLEWDLIPICCYRMPIKYFRLLSNVLICALRFSLVSRAISRYLTVVLKGKYIGRRFFDLELCLEEVVKMDLFSKIDSPYILVHVISAFKESPRLSTLDAIDSATPYRQIIMGCMICPVKLSRQNFDTTLR